jgi:glutamate N-acetyltransferase / amino-acid N-acetyltransferase
MIHPDLGPEPPQATMLAFLFTDAIVPHAVLAEALFRSADSSFNACSVDGDTSTNDCVIALASGASGQRVEPAALEAALSHVSSQLARSMVADGEGAEHVAEIRVLGLRTNDEARRVARTIATSMLVKTALFGKDVNWGRLLAAAGRAGVSFDPSRARIAVGGIEIVRQGVGVGQAAELAANQVLAQQSYLIEIQLGEGPGAFTYLTSDLGHGYVDVNAGYRS